MTRLRFLLEGKEIYLIGVEFGMTEGGVVDYQVMEGP
jgi:hypothetical protein